VSLPSPQPQSAISFDEEVDREVESRIAISGRVTIDSSPALRALLFRKLESSQRRIVLNFEGVSYVDTSGLAVLVEALKAARSRGKTLRLTGLRDRPRYLLEAIGVLKLFEDTQEKADL